MTVQELINKLNAIEDKTRIVILQKDVEGNGFSPLRGIDDNSTYAADNTWSGEVGVQTLTEELIKRGFSEEESFRQEVKAVKDKGRKALTDFMKGL